MKTVYYMGRACLVPEWTRFISTDKNGEVRAYEKRPEINRVAGFWDVAWVSGGRSITVDIGLPDWSDSLVEIE